MSSSRQKGLRIAVVILTAVVAVTIAFPIWLPWVLRPVLAHFGVRFGDYRRDGFTRFTLFQVQYDRAPVSARVERATVRIPWGGLLSKRHGTAETTLDAEGWTLRVASAPKQSPAPNRPSRGPAHSAPSTPADVVEQVRKIATSLERWVAHAELKRGTVELPRRRFLVPVAHWNTRQLTVLTQLPRSAQGVRVQLRLPPSSPWDLQAEVPSAQLTLHAVLNPDPSGPNARGSIQWQTNQLSFQAAFAGPGWLPQFASARSDHFRIPAALLGLEGYDDLTGRLAGSWTNQQFHVDLRASAQPTASGLMLPVNATIHLSGTTNSVLIEEALIRSPALTAELSPGTTLDFSGQMISGPATVEVKADLSRQRWFPARGKLSVLALLAPGQGPIPDTEFRLTGEGLTASGVAVDGVQITGRSRWPMLEIQECRAGFAEGAVVSLVAQGNLQSRVISNGVLHVEGKAGAALLPRGWEYDRLVAHLNVRGPVQNLKHDGFIAIDRLLLPKTTNLNLTLQWQGAAANLDRLTGAVRAGDTTLHLAGSASGQAHGPGLRVKELTLGDPRQTAYRLQAPFHITLDRAGRTSPQPWHIKLQPVAWQSPDSQPAAAANPPVSPFRRLTAEADILWPDRGRFRLGAENFDLAVFGPFASKPLPALQIDRWDIHGGWTNGPLVFTTEAAARLTTGKHLPLGLHFRARSEGQGLFVDHFQVAAQSAPVLKGEGVLPVYIEPGDPAQRVRLAQTEPLRLSATSASNRAFWNQVSDWTHVTLTEPQVALDISGSIAAPIGVIRAQMAALQMARATTNPMPRLEDIRLTLDLTRTSARVHPLQLRVEGQPVVVNAWAPIGPDFSISWRHFLHLDRATGAVQVAQAQLGPFARFLPKTLSPQGVLDIDVSLRPGLQFGGRIDLTGAATRPIPSVGVIDQVTSQLRLNGQTIEVKTLTGLLGGEPFGVTGTVDFANRKPTTGLPQLALIVRGEDLPLARKPDLILRGDLDLAISNRTNDNPIVTGTVRLRDSVFLSDLRALVPGKVAQPRQRPPYFSIDVEPLASWGLNLRVRGERFLKVRSPLFQGLVSTTLKLDGTMKEPMARGDVTVASGTVQFPFANLDVTQGLISLTSADPFHPQLFVSAGGRALGYDVKMEVTGKADSPVLQFSSTPPLSSEQVVLMLTAGEVPQQGNYVSTQQRASRLALFLGKNLLSEFSSGPGLADRLTVRSGEYLSEQGKQTYSLEYRLSPRWSIVGEYDRFGAFNGDLKWHLYSR